MKVVRIYTGDDNQSHFEDVDLPYAPGGESETTPPRAASQAKFNRYPAGFVLDWHTAPQRQYVVTLSGQAEIEIGDGTKRQFGPGDVLLAEDRTGQGHITRVIGGQPRTTLWVALAE
jgi:hypothetical protein